MGLRLEKEKAVLERAGEYFQTGSKCGMGNQRDQSEKRHRRRSRLNCENSPFAGESEPEPSFNTGEIAPSIRAQSPLV